MKTYNFIIRLTTKVFSESMANRLFEAGCTDAILCHDHENGVYLDFSRESISFEEAKKSAIKDIEKAGYWRKK